MAISIYGTFPFDRTREINMAVEDISTLRERLNTESLPLSVKANLLNQLAELQQFIRAHTSR